MYVNNDIDYIHFLKKKSVWIFGAGKRGNLCAKLLKKNDVDIAGFIDNNNEKSIENYTVYTLEEWRNFDKNAIIVISSFEKEIKEQLMNHDIYNFISMSQIDFGGGVNHYDENYFMWQRDLNKFGAKIQISMFSPYIKKDMRVVEFGCSSGALCKLVKAREVIGIEINPVARSFAKESGITCVETANEIEENSVDLVISSHVLEHVENPLGELRSLYRILKHGGGIVFYVPNESCETEYSRSDFDNHLYTWNCLNIGNLFKAAGFFVYSVERIQEVWPKNYLKLYSEMSEELFEELCCLGGKINNDSSCLIVAYKNNS